MASNGLYIIGFQLLFLSQVAHSFILLTANMEDVKKIARKFVSDSLAEKIAEFVAKATEQMVKNVSEENDKNADQFQNLSQENDKILNIGRQRYEKATRNTKDDVNDQGRTKKHVAYDKEITTPSNRVAKDSNPGQIIDWEKENNEIAYEKLYSKEAETQEKSKHDYEQFNVDYEKPRHDNERVKHNMEPKETSDSPNHDYEQKLDYELPTPNYELLKPDYELPKPDYELPKPDYELPKPDYELPKPDYELRKPDYELPKPDYELPKRDYEHTKHDIQPKINYEHPKIKRPKLHHEWKKLNDPREHPHQQLLDDEEQRLEEQPDEEPVYEKKPVYEKPKTAYVQPKPTRKPKNHVHQRQKVNLKEQWPPSHVKPESDHKTSKLPTPTVHSTILYKALRAGNTEHKKTHRGHKLAGLDSQEVGNTHETATATLQAFNIPVSLTTERERLEFDQYDNPNNLKEEFIATSGPVALPKVPMIKPWWEKEMALMRK